MSTVILSLTAESLKEMLNFNAAHGLRLSLPFFRIPRDLDLRLRDSESVSTSKSGILEILPS